MNWLAVVPMVVAASGAVTVFLNRQYRHPRSLHRARLDLEIMNLLPETSRVREGLLQQTEATIERALTVGANERRDWQGVVLSAIFLCATGGLVFEAVDNGGTAWWLVVPAFFTGSLTCSGFAQSVPKKLRDVNDIAVSTIPDEPEKVDSGNP